MKIVILSYGDEKVKKWRKISFKNKEKYCKKHGYDFIGSSKKYDDRPATWSKLLMIKEYLPLYDWIFWSDIDSLIVNSNIKLEKFIDDNFDFIISKIKWINTGQFFIKNSELGERIIKDIYNQKQYVGLKGNEEDAVRYLFSTNEYIDIVREKIKIIDNASFNKMPIDYNYGDFIIHYAGQYKDFNSFKLIAKLYG